MSQTTVKWTFATEEKEKNGANTNHSSTQIDHNSTISFISYHISIDLTYCSALHLVLHSQNILNTFWGLTSKNKSTLNTLWSLQFSSFNHIFGGFQWNSYYEQVLFDSHFSSSSLKILNCSLSVVSWSTRIARNKRTHSNSNRLTVELWLVLITQK